METKRQYIERLAARLIEWDARIDELKARAELASSEAKLTYRKKLAELRELRERVATQLSLLREAGDTGWQDIRKTVDRLIEDVNNLLKDIRKTFKKAA